MSQAWEWLYLWGIKQARLFSPPGWGPSASLLYELGCYHSLHLGSFWMLISVFVVDLSGHFFGVLGFLAHSCVLFFMGWHWFLVLFDSFVTGVSWWHPVFGWVGYWCLICWFWGGSEGLVAFFCISSLMLLSSSLKLLSLMLKGKEIVRII